MSTQCHGCDKTFVGGNFLRHLRKTKEPNCLEYGKSIGKHQVDAQTAELLDSLLRGSSQAIPSQEQKQMGAPIVVDLSGDFFGDYDGLNDVDMDMGVDPPQIEISVGTVDDVLDLEDDGDDFEDEDEEDNWEPPHNSGSFTHSPSPELKFPEGYFDEPLQLPKSRAPIESQGMDVDENTQYFRNLNAEANIWAPFGSEIEWEIARWAKLRGPTSTALTELLAIDTVCEKLGLSYRNTNQLNAIIDTKLPFMRPKFKSQEVTVQGQAYEMYFRNVLECLKSLYSDAEFAEYLKFAPERHFENAQCEKQLYHDMYTGGWWWSTQMKLDKHAGPGRTVIPIILSSDKTQVTLFRNKAVYPVYMTLGNIPKELRRKPSRRAYVLLGYLPTTSLEHIKNAASRRCSLANLFHTCMRTILNPLEDAGTTGLVIASGDGVKRHGHPIFAAHIGDYPEQVLVSCCISGHCPRCTIPRQRIGENTEPHPLRHLRSILNALQMIDNDAAAFVKACQDAGVKPVFEPFWACLPYSNVYLAITPDILHQLYQGVFKHMKTWVIEAYGAHEIDTRCRRLPPNHNVRIFMKGISALQRVSGAEHAQISSFLLGLVVEAPLPDGMSSLRLVRCLRGLVDFLYLSQYPVHSTSTLGLLSDALERFHANKGIFIDLSIRSNFGIPKIHFMNHYVDGIQLMEYTERLHIDLAKDAYRASNKKDELSQMTVWLERKEKVMKHVAYLEWVKAGKHPPLRSHWIPPGMNTTRTLKMAKHPSVYSVKTVDVVQRYGATFFKAALARFVVQLKDPNLSGARLDDAAEGLFLGVSHVSVYHRIKYIHQDSFTGILSTADSIHVQPARDGKHGRSIPGRFDTALVRISDSAGPLKISQDTRVAQVRIVFTLPEQASENLFHHVRAQDRPRYLAYVEWFTPFTTRDVNHGLYKISHSNVEGGRLASIVDIERFLRSVHLLPRFGCVANREWTSSSVLEDCPSFLVNSDSDRHMYQFFAFNSE
ncbi:hypothetical protein F5890DRAFT_1570502 [Lentinula detonsa]|uniref:C2H2-type domain-containing protein n=1 Tax=Lentinula detonsa TaxID=2804962 RepID=A0AA38Q814_9AGAR|nr:hypothetical protein F5890DRAFT_1570502 [Lentinula detonsa]